MECVHVMPGTAHKGSWGCSPVLAALGMEITWVRQAGAVPSALSLREELSPSQLCFAVGYK